MGEGMSLLSEYAICVEGFSNLAKTEDKLTAQDQARIKKLSEDRADACARLLKASGVKNEITCVGQGALKGEAKGCVRLVVCKTLTPPEVKDSQVEQPEIKAAEIDFPQVEAEKPGTSGVQNEITCRVLLRVRQRGGVRLVVCKKLTTPEVKDSQV